LPLAEGEVTWQPTSKPLIIPHRNRLWWTI